MKIKRTNLSEGRTELQITAPVEKVREAIRFIEYQLAFQNRINPQDTEDLTAAIKERVGEAYYYSFINFEVMRFLVHFAITQEKIAIMGTPKVVTTEKTVDPRKEFSFKAIVMLKPEYEIDDFSPVTIQIPQVHVSEQEIDERLINIAEGNATYTRDEDRPLQDGDDLYFSIKTVDSKGDSPPSLNAERRPYKIGQNFLPGGFDKHLIGMEVGQTKTFDVTAKEFKAFDSDSQGETATLTFTITILEVTKRIIPAITDLWVKENVPGMTSVPEFRERLRRQGIESKQKELEGMKYYAAASEFAKRFKGKIANEHYELIQEEILNNLQKRLQAQGKSLQDFAKEQPGGEEMFSMQLMMQTREVLVQGFSLDALARHLKLTVTPEDIKDTFIFMAPGNEQMARTEYEMTGRMYQIEEATLRRKANRWLVETATIEYV